MKYISKLLLLGWVCCGSAAFAATTTTTNPVIFNPSSFNATKTPLFIKNTYQLVQGQHMNQNAKNMGPSGYPTTSYGQQMAAVLAWPVGQMSFNNGHIYFTVPYTTNYWVIMDTYLANLNGGSGEWMAVNVWSMDVTTGNTQLCLYQVNMPGGGSDGNGGGYTYYNSKTCGPIALTAGDQIAESIGVYDSGTSPALGIIAGTITIQNYQDW